MGLQCSNRARARAIPLAIELEIAIGKQKWRIGPETNQPEHDSARGEFEKATHGDYDVRAESVRKIGGLSGQRSCTCSFAESQWIDGLNAMADCVG